MITIDSLPVDQTAKVREDGTAQSELKVQTSQLSYGKHLIQVIQEVDDKQVISGGSFVKAAIDDFDGNIQSE